MPNAIKVFVKYVDKVNWALGLVVMYMIFVIMGILFWSSISKTFFLPSLWTLEMAQFTMVAYYMLGGGYSMQINAHVRMDLLYSRWKPKKRAFTDTLTSFCLVFYLCVLLYGGYSSTEYAIQYGEKSYSSWAPKMWPIKVIMDIGIFLMLLQTIATFFKDLAKARGVPITDDPEDEEALV